MGSKGQNTMLKLMLLGLLAPSLALSPDDEGSLLRKRPALENGVIDTINDYEDRELQEMSIPTRGVGKSAKTSTSTSTSKSAKSAKSAKKAKKAKKGGKKGGSKTSDSKDNFNRMPTVSSNPTASAAPTNVPTITPGPTATPAPTPEPTVIEPTISPQPTPEECYDGTKEDYLASVIPSPEAGTAQELAFDFMVSSDPFWDNECDAEKLLQRYGLLTIYFSTGGSSWTNTDGWLESGDCDFWGVTCDDSGLVTELNLCKSNHSKCSDSLWTIPQSLFSSYSDQ